MHDDEIKHISHLLNLFMDGKTTLDEEAELSEYFATHNVPDEWADYKAMMAYFDAGMPLLDSTASPTASPRRRAAIVGMRHKTMWWAAAAIVVALAVNAVLLITHNSENATPTASLHATTTMPAKPSATSTTEATIAATTPHAPHRTIAKKAQRATTAALKAYHDSIATANLDGEIELCYMMAQADYDEWLNELKQIQDADRATMLIQQGAELAMQCDNDTPTEVY